MASDSARVNGEAVREYRKSIRMSQPTLAGSCMKSGMWVSGLESGKPGFVATRLELYKLAARLGIAVDDIEAE